MSSQTRSSTRSSRTRLAEAARLKWSRYIPHSPTAKQRWFLLLPQRELLYGGAAGGGKSDAVLMAGLQWVDEPGYAGLIIRRTYQDLAKPGALMDRAHGWLAGTGARWHQDTATWHFPEGGKLAFGYVRNDQDLQQYQSAEFQYVGWDELTQFTLHQYRFMLSRLRRLEGSRIPLRVRAGTNPGGTGHEWVKERWRLGSKYEGLEPPEGRRFVPAMLEDNPHLDAEEYEQALAELDPVLRQQLRLGNWDVAYSGTKFKRDWFAIVEEAPAEARKVRYWDLAATEPKAGRDPDYTVGLRMSVDELGVYYVEHVVRVRATPGEVERTVAQTAETDGRAVAIFMEQEPGSAGKSQIDHYRRRVLPGFEFRGHRTTGSKEIRANPVSSQAEPGNIKLVRGGWNEAFLDELLAFPNDAHDDQVDALSGAFTMLTRRRQWRAY